MATKFLFRWPSDNDVIENVPFAAFDWPAHSPIKFTVSFHLFAHSTWKQVWSHFLSPAVLKITSDSIFFAPIVPSISTVLQSTLEIDWIFMDAATRAPIFWACRRRRRLRRRPAARPAPPRRPARRSSTSSRTSSTPPRPPRPTPTTASAPRSKQWITWKSALLSDLVFFFGSVWLRYSSINVSSNENDFGWNRFRGPGVFVSIFVLRPRVECGRMSEKKIDINEITSGLY